MADSASLAVGKQVRAIRKAAGLTQIAVAARGGFDPNFLGRVERGAQNLTLATLVRLAQALGVGVADLVMEVRADEVSVAELNAASPRRQN